MKNSEPLNPKCIQFHHWLWCQIHSECGFLDFSNKSIFYGNWEPTAPQSVCLSILSDLCFVCDSLQASGSHWQKRLKMTHNDKKMTYLHFCSKAVIVLNFGSGTVYCIWDWASINYSVCVDGNEGTCHPVQQCGSLMCDLYLFGQKWTFKVMRLWSINRNTHNLVRCDKNKEYDHICPEYTCDLLLHL